MFYPYDGGYDTDKPEDDEGFGMYSGTTPEEKEEFDDINTQPVSSELEGFGLIW